MEFTPSLQKGTGEESYESIPIGTVRLPISSPTALLALVLKTLFGVASARIGRPSAIYAYNQDPENVVPGFVLKLLYSARLAVIYHHVTPSKVQSFGEGFSHRRADGYTLAASIYNSLVPAINRFCAIRADAQISLSETTRSEVRDVLGLRDVTVAGNGLDHSKFRLVERRKVYDGIFLGRLVPQKGIDILLRAWKMVVREMPTAALVLVGGTDKSQLLEYEKMIRELDLQKHVTITGFLGDTDVVNLLNSSKLFVFPSRREGFAQAVSQAMSCGLCCVLSDIPSLRQVYGDAAVFVPQEDPEKLSSAILSLLGDEKMRKRIIDLGMELSKRFDWESVVEREYSAVFNSLLTPRMAISQ